MKTEPSSPTFLPSFAMQIAPTVEGSQNTNSFLAKLVLLALCLAYLSRDALSTEAITSLAAQMLTSYIPRQRDTTAILASLSLLAFYIRARIDPHALFVNAVVAR